MAFLLTVSVKLHPTFYKKTHRLTGRTRLISRLIMSGDDGMLIHRVWDLANWSSFAAGSGTSIRRYRHRRASLSLKPVVIVMAVSGCSHSPTMDLLGSYFPAWMLCAALGVVAAVIIRQLLAVAGIAEYVVVPLLTYAGLAVFVTLLVWLFWFGH
jgi:hypothetical protein